MRINGIELRLKRILDNEMRITFSKKHDLVILRDYLMGERTGKVAEASRVSLENIRLTPGRHTDATTNLNAEDLWGNGLPPVREAMLNDAAIRSDR